MLYNLLRNTIEFPILSVPWDYFKFKANIPNVFSAIKYNNQYLTFEGEEDAHQDLCTV